MKAVKDSDQRLSDIARQFTENYLRFLDNKVLSSLDFLKEKNELKAFAAINNSLPPLYKNHLNFLRVALHNKEKATTVTRLGDMHNGGKCTLLIETEGAKWVYKPVSADLLCLLNRTLYVLNNSQLFGFVLPEVRENKPDSSEIVFINHEEVSDTETFAYHYGALLVVITLLRGVDFHRENMLCVNSVPVVVDCETLFYPVLKETKPFDASATAMLPTALNQQSVLSTLNLSVKRLIEGVDAACCVIEKAKVDIKDIIVAGNKLRRRLIFKPTRFYYQVLRASLHPALLADSNKRSDYIKQCLQGEHRISQAIRHSERQDLMAFDIPYFSYRDGQLCHEKYKH